MAHESFENPAIAELMNAHFVNIKVDREERPDLDQIYQHALALLGQQGGWPLTMFLTPAGEPFWGGTYFPPKSRYGRPGLPEVLETVGRIWRDERHKVASNTTALKEALARLAQPGGAVRRSRRRFARQTARRLVQAFDTIHGGLGGAPKFPQAPLLDLLWREALASGDAAMRHAVAAHADQHLPGRHLRPPGRRLRALCGRRALAGAALREDAVRQRPAARRCWPMPMRRPATGCSRRARRRPSAGSSARCWSATPSRPASMPTARARRAGTTSGTRPRSTACWARMRPPSGSPTASPTAATGRAGRCSTACISRGCWRRTQEARLRASADRLLAARAERVPPGRDDKVLADWNGLMIARAGPGERGVRAAGLARAGAPRLRLRHDRDDDRRPARPQLARGPDARSRLPRGLRQHGGRGARPVRAHRGARLPRPGASAGPCASMPTISTATHGGYFQVSADCDGRPGPGQERAGRPDASRQRHAARRCSRASTS